MSILDEIARKHGTDKSSESHNYCVKYEKFLPFKRQDTLTIMEIGVQEGKSIHMWEEYFYQSNIIGIDILPECKKIEKGRIKIEIEIGSQFDGNFLFDVGKKYFEFDMILDDGSHDNEHVIFSFEQLFPYIKPNGVYIIEDVCTSYWEYYGGGYGKYQSTMEYFKRLSDDVNFRGLVNYDFPENVNARREDKLSPYSEKVQPDCITNIESINFLNGIIIITKKDVTY